MATGAAQHLSPSDGQQHLAEKTPSKFLVRPFSVCKFGDEIHLILCFYVHIPQILPTQGCKHKKEPERKYPILNPYKIPHLLLFK